MTDDNKTAFADALGALGTVFGAPVPPTLLTAYWQFLRDLELPAFLRAVAEAGRTLKWFPKPSELRELAGDSTKTKGALAWGAVMEAMNKHDYTRSVDFGPLVNAVVRNMGGWLWLCDRDKDDLTFDRKKFEELYTLLSVKPQDELRGAYLPGQFGGPVERIAIDGVTPARQLEAPHSEEARDLVRVLANGHSLEPPREKTPPARSQEATEPVSKPSEAKPKDAARELADAQRAAEAIQKLRERVANGGGASGQG